MQQINRNSVNVYNNFRDKSCVQTSKKLRADKYWFQKKQLQVMESFQMQNSNYLENSFDLFE